MHGAHLPEILVLLIAAVFIVALFKKLHLSPVLGYLVAGGIIGPYGLKYIQDIETTKYIAEFGVVFMLFAIGLELTFNRLKSMRLHVFGFGTAQMLVTGGAIGIVAYLLGMKPATAVVIGGGLALSSTATVIQVLSERKEQATQIGRLSLATLILQDLAVVPLLIMVPLFAQENANILGAISGAFLQATLVIIVIFISGTRLLQPLFGAIADLRSQELFIATTLIIVLGAAWVTDTVELSLALGAFIAGLLVAETEYRHQVETDIEPFRGLLMGLFFMAVGMSIDFILMKEKLLLILILTGALIVGKALIITLLSRAFNFKIGPSMQAGFILSQGSEFAFVLFGLAAAKGVLDQEIAQILLVVVSITMAVTPLLAAAGGELFRRIERRNPLRLEHKDMSKETKDLDNHIIVAGFGRVGKTICTLLAARGINYVALDEDPKNVHQGRKNGSPVYYGHAEKLDILKSLGIERAKMIALTIDNKKATRNAIMVIRQAFPDLPIIARAKDGKHARELSEVGATIALAEAFESSLILGSAILKKSGAPDHEIESLIEQFRYEEYPLSQIREVLKQGRGEIAVPAEN